MKTFQKIFRDKKVLQEMLDLVQDGFSISSIARKFQIDHKSVRYQITKSQMPPVKATKKLNSPPQRIPKDLKNTDLKDFYVENGERINVGKSYQEYLDAERLRKEKLFNKRFKELTRR